MHSRQFTADFFVPGIRGHQPGLRVNPSQLVDFNAQLVGFFLAQCRVGNVIDDDANVMNLTVNRFQWNDCGVLVHEGGATGNGAIILEMEQVRALFPNRESARFQLKHGLSFLAEPGFRDVGKQRKQILALGILRADATVAVHKAIPKLDVVFLVENHQANVDILKNIHQPMDVAQINVGIRHS